MNAEFAIREATVADIPEILRQRCSMYRDTGSLDEALLAEMVESSTAYLQQAMPAGSFRAWLAQSPDGASAGGGAVIVSPWLSRPHSLQARQACILNVYTYPRHRRRGVARSLMRTMIDWCRQQGFAYASLHASPNGQPLYASMGFEPTGELRLKLR